jgi:hypothetical protein
MDERWPIFKEKALRWLEKLFGPQRLFAVVEHTLDEKCLHLHFYVVPLENEDISHLHPGLRALQTLPDSAIPRQRQIAYRQAMSDMLDDFHVEVGRDFDLVRRHVNAKRMTRSEWHRWHWYRDQKMQQGLSDHPRNTASLAQDSLDAKDKRIVASHHEHAVHLASPVSVPLHLPSASSMPLSVIRPVTATRSAMERLSDIPAARVDFAQGRVKSFLVHTASHLRGLEHEHEEGEGECGDEFTPAKKMVWVRPRQS